MLILKRKKNRFFLKTKYSQLRPVTWHDFFDHVTVSRGS